MLLNFTHATLICHFDCFMFRKSLVHIRNTLSAFFCYASTYIHHAIATECYAHVLSERGYAEEVIKKRVVLVHCHIVTCSFQTKFYSTVSVIVLKSAILSIKVKENIKLNYDYNLHMPAILWQIVVYFLSCIYLKGQEGIS